MPQAVLLVVVYVLVALLPLILLFSAGPTSSASVVFEFGRCVALTVFSMLFVQPLLTARISWVDRPAGRANALRFHKAVGIAALIGLVLHPLGLAFGGAGIGLLTTISLPWFVVIGKATLVALGFHVILALFRTNTGMAYLTWKRVHKATAALILAGAFVHSCFSGSDLSLRALQVLWVALFVLAGAAFARSRFQNP